MLGTTPSPSAQPGARDVGHAGGTGSTWPVGLVYTQQGERHPAGPGLSDEPVVLDRKVCRINRMRRSTLTRARLMTDDLQHGGFRFYPAMVTLTYRQVGDWRPQHVRDFLQRARVWMSRLGQPLRYTWVAELQKRGALHYHVVIWLPRGLTLPKADKRGWWPHGMTRTERARHAVAYLAKYASKGIEDASKPFPRGARICGGGGLSATARLTLRWHLLPRYVRDQVTPDCCCKRRPGGGFSTIHGEVIRSQWRIVLWTHTGVVLVRVQQEGFE